jgi:hypothetical protein
MRTLLADLGVPSHSIANGMPFRPIVEHMRIGWPEYRVLPGVVLILLAAFFRVKGFFGFSGAFWDRHESVFGLLD